MILEIRKAKISEYEKVKAFYYNLIDMMQDAEYAPGWEKGIYPTDNYLKESIENEELFVGMLNGKIIAAMVINHNFNESYRKVNWPTEANPEETMIIHILGVLYTYGGMGFAKQLVKKAIAYAREMQQKVLRLDVLSGNVPAERLYVGAGFEYIDTVRMFYDDTGWMDFKLYEYVL